MQKARDSRSVQSSPSLSASFLARPPLPKKKKKSSSVYPTWNNRCETCETVFVEIRTFKTCHKYPLFERRILRRRQKEEEEEEDKILYNNGVDKLRDHGRGHRRRGVLDAFGYSNEHVDVTTEREDDSKDDGRRLERGKHRGGGEERRGGNREEAEEVIVGLFV